MPKREPAAERWERLIAELEHEIDAGAAIAAGKEWEGRLSPWVAPADLGPLPVSLAARARALVTEQRRVTAVLTEARDSAGRQIAALRLAPIPHQSSGALYLDALG